MDSRSESESEGQHSAYVLDEQVGYLIRLVGQRHSAIFQALAPLGLTPTQFSALVRLAQDGPCSQNELGRRAAMDVATVKGVVDRLRERGLITAAADPGDRRRSILSIAPDQSDLLATLTDAGHRITEETLAPLSRDERRALTGLLRRMAGGQDTPR